MIAISPIKFFEVFIKKLCCRHKRRLFSNFSKLKRIFVSALKAISTFQNKHRKVEGFQLPFDSKLEKIFIF